jgi:hypothetical protein
MASDESADAGAKQDDQATQGVPEAEEAFVRAMIDRGQAAKRVNGVLPPGATHEIVEDRPGQLPKIVRRRFA